MSFLEFIGAVALGIGALMAIGFATGYMRVSAKYEDDDE